ncbi:hypothetical protein PCANC_06770 [Puccinia coronata f. sp. avenae]|uniref:Uncharacterized protein n=1 Tax=Puccinia coronata f. sp. avenae TaxID=200324 RepID=A0A2N5SSH0_9BASI|nr:hypothetical protein PCANC_15367 [Puccinia coronata f. sp. avenae]PLW16187.1 hypothetical protein PCASD_18061 [Puccinia coronata f. sp. avenae]PLW36469.1 hypothetical protein PCASD_11207 [Puccinia coronata f. sp. avenae]PLW48130.1 hypothetical protein PCANC_06770 [Puccinia coronata f. sp. avenae]
MYLCLQSIFATSHPPALLVGLITKESSGVLPNLTATMVTESALYTSNTLVRYDTWISPIPNASVRR